MLPRDSSEALLDYCLAVPVIPVLTIEDPAHARPLARALSRGGLHVIEITLRTSAAIDAIREVAGTPGCIVGAGSLLSPEHVAEAKSAGARFGVSPGATDELVRASAAEELPLLPGASTPSEAMRLLSSGFRFLKFFPAEASGGIDALKSFAGPMRQIAFCPTGGIGPGNAAEYLSLRNVVCVGGSWVAPPGKVANGDWAEIESLAGAASGLASRSRV